jgi:two-component sensor histidine kinase
MIVSSGREVLYVNPRGSEAGVALGEKCFKTFARRDDPCPWCRAGEVTGEGEEAGAEARVGQTAWHMRWVGLGGDRFAHFATDVTDKALELDRLRMGLDEKDVLLGEMGHRSRNMLALIESMLRLDGMTSAAEEKKEALLDAAGRVRTFSRIQDILAGVGTPGGAIPLHPFLEDLIESLAGACGGSTTRIATALDLGDCRIAADHAVPCGLIVNELVTNAFKHAFPAGRGGEIRVSASCAGGFAITVEDNGVGLPPDVDPETTGGFGLSIVSALARQVGGELSVVRGAGAKFILTVPAPDGSAG